MPPQTLPIFTSRLAWRWAAAIALLLMPSLALAHPEGFSGVRVILEPDAIRLESTIHTRDLDRWFPPLAFPDYVAGVTQSFEQQAAELYGVHANDEPLPLGTRRAFLLEPGLVQIDLRYPLSRPLKLLEVEFLQFRKLPRGHQQYITVEDARHPPVDGKLRVLLHDRIDLDSPVSSLDVPPAPATMPAGSPAPPPPEPIVRINFFTDGIWHILGGYDHLLFVAALLLACRSFREAASIITFFTVAHSITLALSAMNLVSVPGRLIEIGIAATIVFVAVENLLHRPKLRWRCVLTTFFGLIHGLGFAKDLKEKLASDQFSQIVWPLVRFSAGVETGHLALVALALPLMLLAKHRTKHFDRIAVPALSCLIAGFGLYWLIARIAGGE